MKMKKILCLISFTLTFFASFSQTKPERTLTHTVTLDTAMKPDYFLVKIGVSEHLRYEGEGRKQKAILVPLDTVIENLQTELRRIGFNQKLTKSTITEKTNRTNGERMYFYEKILFQVSFDFEISSKDSVEYLFAKIDKERLQSLMVSPKFYSTTLDKAKENLIQSGIETIKNYAQKIADENKQRIIKQTNTYLSFSPKASNYTTNYNIYGGQKEFVVDLSNVDYVLTIMYTYSFEDK